VLTMTWLYIQTSISEGLPVSVIEAGLTGKCVVCTNVGGCAELLANPNSGGCERQALKRHAMPLVELRARPLLLCSPAQAPGWPLQACVCRGGGRFPECTVSSLGQKTGGRVRARHL
jgi:hypothetical protein